MLTHEPSWVGGVSAHLPVNLDESLVHYALHLVPGESILEPVPQEHKEWDALPQLVRTWGWPGSLKGTRVSMKEMCISPMLHYLKLVSYARHSSSLGPVC